MRPHLGFRRTKLVSFVLLSAENVSPQAVTWSSAVLILPNMNPISVGMPPPPQIDEEFAQKEKEVTDAVIQVIAMAKRENQEILNEETKAVVVETCKQAVAQTMAFQNTMKGMLHSLHAGWAGRKVDLFCVRNNAHPQLFLCSLPRP